MRPGDLKELIAKITYSSFGGYINDANPLLWGEKRKYHFPFTFTHLCLKEINGVKIATVDHHQGITFNRSWCDLPLTIQATVLHPNLQE